MKLWTNCAVSVAVSNSKKCRDLIRRLLSEDTSVAAATKRLLQARFQLFGAEIEGRVVAAVVAVDRYYPHSQLP